MTAEAETGQPQECDAFRADEPGRFRDRVRVNQAFARLDPSDREVVYHAYHLRCTTGQIAAALNVSEPVVKLRLHHALRAFAHALENPTPRRHECVRSPFAR